MDYVNLCKHSKLDILLINLSVLTKVYPGDRIVNRNNYLVRQPRTFFQPFLRFIRGDNRFTTLEAVQMVVDEFLTLLGKKEFALPDYFLTLAQRLFPEILKHLTHLRNTYITDSTIEGSYGLLIAKLFAEGTRRKWVEEETMGTCDPKEPDGDE